MEATLTLGGLSCGKCVRSLTDAFSKVPGVTHAQVSLSPPEAHLTTSADVPLSVLRDAAAAAGPYTVNAFASSSATQQEHADHAKVAPVVAAHVVEKKPSLYPLVLIVGFIAGTVLLAGWSRSGGVLDWRSLMTDFMAGFFIVFSFFKLLDLRGFADAYQSYDVIARYSRPYACTYPFIELALGIAYLLGWQPTITNGITLMLMLIGSVGVLRALLNKRAIRCACLGTALNLPMTTVTLVEDLSMAAMAAVMLVWTH